MRRMVAGCVLLAVLCLGCDDDCEGHVEHIWHETTITLEDNTPDIIIEEDSTPDIIRETVTILEEDSTPDYLTVVVHEYHYPSGPVPALMLIENGGPAMADAPINGLTEATESSVDDIMVIEQSGTSKWLSLGLLAYPYPPEHIHGLVTSNDADTDHDINVTAGGCRDTTDADNIDLATEITKQIDVGWAVGDDQGGLDAGAVAADTGYAVWLIKRSDTGVVDVLFSLSFTAPTMPTDYDLKQLIAGVRTDGATDLYQYQQRRDYFALIESSNGGGWPREVLDAALPDTTWATGTIEGCPPNCLADLGVQLINATSTTPADGRVMVRSKFAASWAASQEGAVINVETATSNFRENQGRCTVLVDGSKQMEYAATISSGAESFRIYLIGWRMLTRGRP